MNPLRAITLLSVTACALAGAVVGSPAAHAAVDNHLSLVSVASPEVPDANGSVSRAISDNGRFVVFLSSQPNLVAGDPADPAARHLYLRDLQSGTTTRLSQGQNGYLFSNAAISADGGYVVFASHEGDDRTALRLYNRSTGTSPVISAPAIGLQEFYTVAISDDARYVFYTRTEWVNEVFEVKLYRYAVQTGVTDRPVTGKIATINNGSSATIPSSSADGRNLTFVQSLAPSEEYSSYRLVRMDMTTGAKTVIAKSQQEQGIPQNAFGDPAISNDGRYVTYLKPDAQGRPNVYVYDAASGASQLVSHKAGSPATKANGYSYQAQISGDGRYVTFSSDATNIVAGVPAVATIYVYDRQTSAVEAIVKNRQGVYPGSTGGYSSYSYVDGDGSTVAFTTRAQNLSAGATTRLERAYVWQRP